MDKNETPNKDRGAFACSDENYLQHGLTKREYMATHITASMVVGAGYTISGSEMQEICRQAIKQTDYLLNHLKQ